MSNVIQIRDKDGKALYPITDISCVIGLEEGAVTEAVLCWDGASTPVVADIPAGVSVTYGGTTYTGTLVASSDTVGKIYMVATGTSNNYDRYMPFAGSPSYVWQNIGDTTIDLTTYAKQAELDQLEAEVDGIDIELHGESAYDANLTESITQGATHPSTKRTFANKMEAGKVYTIHLLSGTVVNKITFYTFDANNNAVYCKYGSAPTTSTSKTLSPGDSMNILPSTDVYKYAFFCSASDALQTGEVVCNIHRDGTEGLADAVEDLADDVDSINAEIADLESLKDLEDFFGTTKNLFNPEDPDFETGKWISSAGGKNTMSTAAISPFIPLTQEIGTLVASVNGVQMNYGGYGICLYDSNKNYVTGWNEGTKGYAEWQTGVAFARFTLLNYANGNIQIEQGTTPTSYVPYAKGLDGENILPGTIGTDAIANSAITAEKIAGSVTAGGPIAYSSLGGESRVVTIASLANDRLSITDYPRHLKRSGNISASANITTFDNIIVGVINGTDNYNALYAKVDATNVYLCRRFPDERIISQVAHGMTISTFIKVAFQYRDNVAKVVVSTLADIKSFDFTDAYIDSYGLPVCIAGENSQFTDVVLRAGSADMRKPIWVFGDSYVSFYSGRWPYYLLPERLDIDKYALFGLAGGTSADIFPDVEKALMTNTPKFLVWILGMNDLDTSSAVNASWKSVWDSLTAICDAKGIILIGATIPNVPGRRMTFKNDIVRNSGYRYIDFAKAVNAEEAGATWYAGCLDEDEVHPTEAGAKVLCSQVLEDFPEIIDRDAIFD